nr:unnamed protein product [Spirometra erinaceieuropaei]
MAVGRVGNADTEGVHHGELATLLRMDPDFDFSFSVTEPSLSVHKTLLSLNSNLPDSKFSMRDALSALPTDPHEHPTESSQTPKQRIQDVTNFPTTLLTIELKAPTSPATRIDEDSLTYLNQGQSYDLRLSESFGEERMLIKSIVRICFHEEKMQFMESKHLELWQSAHPGERLLDIGECPFGNRFAVACLLEEAGSGRTLGWLLA